MNRDDDHINHYDMHLHVPLHFAISSFRDQLCPITLFNLFTKSSNPNRIHVRVLQQNVEDDVDCFTEYCNLIKLDPAYYAYFDCPFEDSIEVMTIPSSAAKGPTYARALVSEMIRMAFVDEHLDPQDFCLQTDSHMDFVQNFDSELIKDWLLANNEYAILSTYVAPTSDLLNPSFPTKHEVPHLCMVQFTSNVRNWGTKACKDLVRPKLTNAVWGAGLSFSKCHAELKVPYDPYTDFVFDGEEFSRAARFWTHGYDIYTPSRVNVLHDYERSQHDPKHSAWGSNRAHKTNINNDEKSTGDSPGRYNRASAQKLLQFPPDPMLEVLTGNERLVSLLEVGRGDKPLSKEAIKLQRGRYGLGDRRTFDQLIAFSGINTREKKMMGNYCGNLEWVPFDEVIGGAGVLRQFEGINGNEHEVGKGGEVLSVSAMKAKMPSTTDKKGGGWGVQVKAIFFVWGSFLLMFAFFFWRSFGQRQGRGRARRGGKKFKSRNYK